MAEKNSTPRLQEIIIGKAERSKQIRKWEQQGLLRKIAPRVYTSSLEEPAEVVIRRNWYRLVADLFPDALLSHRSALERMPTPEGHLYLTRTHKGLIRLPGLTLHISEGPAPLEDDLPFFSQLRVSGLARAYLENLQRSRELDGLSKTISREQLEEKMEAFVRVKGEQALNQVRDRARAIAPVLGMEKEYTELQQLITDLLGTGLSRRLQSPIARARVWGEPVDPDRIRLFESLYEELAGRDYPDYPERNTTLRSFQHFAFFESYFSNYIEGTEFTLEEARQIITTATPLPARDEDSHDVLGTYQLVSSRQEMCRVPGNPEELITLLKERHGILLQARKAKKPGEFKDINNRAGSTEFVDKELVPGTLKKGYEWYSLLQHPFARAAYMMFMISEVHPFLDGNGRIARVMMNAELCSASLSKIIIPTVYREDYMGALKKLTRQREADAYIRMLLRAWEFSRHLHHEDFDELEAYLVRSNAFLTHKEGYLKIAPPG